MASGNRLKANLEGYMPQRCMLALCFLSKGLKNQCSQHLDTRRWFPHTASDSTSFWGEEQGTCYQAKMWLVDREFPTSPEGSHAPWEDKVYACLCNKAKQMDTLEEEKAAKNITTGLTNTQSEISSPTPETSSPYGIEAKAFWCREKYLRDFPSNLSPCHPCQLLLL